MMTNDEGEDKDKLLARKERACFQEKMLARRLRKNQKKTKVPLIGQLRKRQFALCALNHTTRTGYNVETAGYGFMRLVQTSRSCQINMSVIFVSFRQQFNAGRY